MTPPVVNAATAFCAPFGPMNVTLAAGTAVLMPWELPEAYEVVKGYWRNGSASLAGSVQVGVYTADFRQLAASATAVQSGVDVLQEVAFSPTVLIPRGLVYLVVATSGAGTLSCFNTIGGSTAIALQLAKATGQLLASSAYPLPATLTTVVTTVGLGLFYGVSNRSLVA
jgi:hypothetical protein